MKFEHFAEAFAHRERVTAENRQKLRDLEAALHAAVLADAKARFPRKRFGDDHVKAWDALGDAADAIKAPFEASAQLLRDEHEAFKQGIDARLAVLADRVEIPITDDLTLMAESHASNWGSQGYGASKYAKAHAEARADVALALGLRAEVRPVNERPIGGDHPITYVDYGVFVNTTPMGWEVALHKGAAAVPLRTWVLNCWRRGVNPRVYYPFLPHGYEEQVGIHYGTDLLAKAAETAR